MQASKQAFMDDENRMKIVKKCLLTKHVLNTKHTIHIAKTKATETIIPKYYNGVVKESMNYKKFLLPITEIMV